MTKNVIEGVCNICIYINRTEPMEKVRANKFIIIREYKFVKVLEYENIFHMGIKCCVHHASSTRINSQ